MAVNLKCYHISDLNILKFEFLFLQKLRALVFFVTNDVVNFINIIRARFSYESHCPNETIIAIIFAIIISKNTRDTWLNFSILQMFDKTNHVLGSKKIGQKAQSDPIRNGFLAKF